MTLLPPSFLLRVCYPCRYLQSIPGDDDLLDLPESYRLENFASMDARPAYADIRLAWNEGGLGLQVEVTGKDQLPQGDIHRPRASDGLTLWLDTRDARASHRASRYCHQLHFLAAGGGADRDEPLFAQTKINRAVQDAAAVSEAVVLLARRRAPGGYRLEAFVAAEALTGFDPEQHPRLGVFYAVRDHELGEQLLGAGPEFP